MLWYYIKICIYVMYRLLNWQYIHLGAWHHTLCVHAFIFDRGGGFQEGKVASMFTVYSQWNARSHGETNNLWNQHSIRSIFGKQTCSLIIIRNLFLSINLSFSDFKHILATLDFSKQNNIHVGTQSILLLFVCFRGHTQSNGDVNKAVYTDNGAGRGMLSV